MRLVPPTAIDPRAFHDVAAILGDRAAEVSDADVAEVMAHIRAAHAAFKLLEDVERRNARILEVDDRESWTRLDTMKPFHPDDQAELEAQMARQRSLVLAEGRRAGLEEARRLYSESAENDNQPTDPGAPLSEHPQG